MKVWLTKALGEAVAKAATRKEGIPPCLSSLVLLAASGTGQGLQITHTRPVTWTCREEIDCKRAPLDANRGN